MSDIKSEYREFSLQGGNNKVCLNRSAIAFVLQPLVLTDPTLIFCSGCQPVAVTDGYTGIAKWLRDDDLTSLQELN